MGVVGCECVAVSCVCVCEFYCSLVCLTAVGLDGGAGALRLGAALPAAPRAVPAARARGAAPPLRRRLEGVARARCARRPVQEASRAAH